MKLKCKTLILGISLFSTAVVSFNEMRAQDSRETEKPNRPILGSLRDSIKIVEEDIRLLQHFLEASTTDPRMIQNTLTKSWILRNPELRDSLFYALVQADSSVQSEAGAEAEVLATETNDIIEVRFGTAVFKGMALKEALDKSADKRLYQKIVESGQYSKDIELRTPSFRIPTTFEPELTPYDKLLNEFTPVTIHINPDHEKAKFDLSLYGLIFKIGPTWGGEIKVGNDELGFPFWSSGKTAFMATYKRVKFGFELPFQPGRFGTEVFPPFTVRGRKLNGTRGIVGEFDFGPAGGGFSVSRLTDRDKTALTNPNDFAYISAFAQLYYSFGVSLNPTNLVRAKVGMGFHRVREATLVRKPIDPAGATFQELISVGHQTQYGSPYLKFEYLNKDITEKFGASVQYYDYIILATAWLEIVPNVVRLDLKYSWIVLRDVRRWENTDFVIISPHIRFSL